MNYKIFIMAVLLISFGACKNSGDHQHDSTNQHETEKSPDGHDHNGEHHHAEGEGHQHDNDAVEGHQHTEGEEFGHDHDGEHQHAEGETHQHDSDVAESHQHAEVEECGHDHEGEQQNATEVHQHKEGEECNHEEESVSLHREDDGHHHGATTGQEQKSASPDGHNHAPSPAATDGHDHEDVKFQITAYSENFEVFAESDPFASGNSSAILAHFTWLDNFKPLTHGSVKAILKVGEKEYSDLQKQPLRDGIYLFNIQAEMAGNAQLTFLIETDGKVFTMEIPNLKIFDDNHDAIHWAETQEVNSVNTTVFTKEQSWKVGFKTQSAELVDFGKVIKTTALTQPCVAGEAIISSKSNGIVDLQSNHITDGMYVKKGQKLFIVSGNELANNNSSVRFIEAKNNYEKALSNYERAKELEKDKIVTTKELLEAKNEYENTKVIYENLQANFSSQGQIITSPIDGYINNLRVSNGEYVEAGYPLLGITKNQRLILNADIQQKYASVLPQLYTATIRTVHNNNSYSLEELNGHILSYGKTTNANNYLIPITLEIDNTDDFVAGGFVELYLKYKSKCKSLIIPKASLLEEQGNFFVFVQVHPELFEKREVKIGDTDGQYIEIKSGLKAKERIVSEGAILIKLAQSTGALDAHSGHVH